MHLTAALTLLILGNAVLLSTSQTPPPEMSGLYAFRQAAPASLGVLFLVSSLAILIVLSKVVLKYHLLSDWRNESKLFAVRGLGYFSTIILILSGLFHFFGTEWLVAYQTSFFSLLGLYAVWSMDKSHMFLYMILSIFNWFCLAGRLPLFGYTKCLAEVNFEDCYVYFVGNNPQAPTVIEDRCSTYGYLNFLRLVGLLAIFFQAISAYVTLLLYRWDKTSEVSSYQPLKDAKPVKPTLNDYSVDDSLSWRGYQAASYSHIDDHDNDDGDHEHQDGSTEKF